MGDYQVMPPLSADQREELKASIAKNGMLEPVEVDDQGDILDGHHRVELWNELRADGVKVADYPTRRVNGMSEAEKRNYVLTVNLARRHLKPEDRAELVGSLREQGWSIRRIARATGAGVGTIHADTEREGVQDRTPAVVTGEDNKPYPSKGKRRRKARTPVAGHAPKPKINVVDARVEDILSRLAELLASLDNPSRIAPGREDDADQHMAAFYNHSDLAAEVYNRLQRYTYRLVGTASADNPRFARLVGEEFGVRAARRVRG